MSFDINFRRVLFVVNCDANLWRSVGEKRFAMYGWSMNSEFAIWQRKTMENLILLTSLNHPPTAHWLLLRNIALH